MAPLVVVAVGCAILFGSVLGARIHVPVPVVLLVTGCVLAAVPQLDGVGLPSGAVLFVFLPLLLYWESLSTSLREIRRYVRAISLNSTLLVVATAGAVAIVLHSLGVGWGPAWLIGAALAPTDATAVASLGTGLPRRNATVLQAESLINDGTALVVFTLALSLSTGHGRLTLGAVARLCALSFGGGLAIGLITGWLVFQVRRRLLKREDLNLVSVLTPFAAYLAADQVGASGVLAVVTCGLFMSQVTPRVVAANARVQGEAFWTLVTFILNGALFVLVGLALPASIRGLSSATRWHALGLVAATYTTVLAIRYLFVQLSVVLIRAIDRRPQQRELRTSARYRVVHTIAGFRGGVSLAMALSVPITLQHGGRLASRDLVVFVSAVVVVLTLIVQGPVLPRAIRWARLPADEDVVTERRLAQTTAIDAALSALPDLARDTGAPYEVVQRVQDELINHRDAVTATGDDDPALVHGNQYERLQLALLAVKRATIVDLRDDGTIDDVVLRDLQSRLDIEEVRYQA